MCSKAAVNYNIKLCPNIFPRLWVFEYCGQSDIRPDLIQNWLLHFVVNRHWQPTCSEGNKEDRWFTRNLWRIMTCSEKRWTRWGRGRMRSRRWRRAQTADCRQRVVMYGCGEQRFWRFLCIFRISKRLTSLPSVVLHWCRFWDTELLRVLARKREEAVKVMKAKKWWFGLLCD